MKPISKEWTDRDRLRVIDAILPGMSDDIYAGRYSSMGRANITTLTHIIHDPAEVLEEYRKEFEQYLEENAKRCQPAIGAEFANSRLDE